LRLAGTLGIFSEFAEVDHPSSVTIRRNPVSDLGGLAAASGRPSAVDGFAAARSP
jgi:hypothetical protein